MILLENAFIGFFYTNHVQFLLLLSNIDRPPSIYSQQLNELLGVCTVDK
jgi:hypothetical protein